MTASRSWPVVYLFQAAISGRVRVHTCQLHCRCLSFFQPPLAISSCPSKWGVMSFQLAFFDTMFNPVSRLENCNCFLRVLWKLFISVACVTGWRNGELRTERLKALEERESLLLCIMLVRWYDLLFVVFLSYLDPYSNLCLLNIK